MGTISISSYFVGIKGAVVMSCIAFSIVFIVIAGLMLMMMALKIFSAPKNEKDGTKNNGSSASVPTPPPSSGATLAVASSSAALAVPDDGELIAVITAAVTAACGAGARVLSFAPSAPRVLNSAWRMTGRIANSEGFAD